MADSTGFSHITVNADTDDDVVIQAGIVDAPADDDEVVVEEDVAALADDGAPADEDAAPADEQDGPAPAPRRPSAPAPDDGYRETTLDDIEGAKMPTAQKAVIIVALLGVAAFILWYLFAR
ncbi:SURF2 Surfeit locus protein 2 [Adlercreutzia sp. R21]|uniref:SURF2 Surfeit locus protein 2 n=1 Tax=Adlercreutzia wanghongyangiae TaxID=3111451 RepID=UPI002DBADC94|nr:SURF2 Surfeit locus protein 2 [Adlercreutzia sp. R21]MEC4183343.1 SURF2 Surfeit locus protein 2 [Adlercreutzia sp. R21]